jgi:hypothetical protein
VPNWVCWKFVWKTTRRASASGPNANVQGSPAACEEQRSIDIGTYEQALAAFERANAMASDSLSGTDIGAFDIDKCRDRATRKCSPSNGDR